ncbi:hypothetical protein ATO10_09263 [Actibacterium atlanticum]|uniref:ABM domain-containing protein n=1 Tax=Actibacterium atlanticum TaxID=1461693 RepID=A0A058ZK76_9RHOB|nr:hypothetical protein [Actibacterium atlanticum]KCV82024.1 hypothetical protein ATO10_09263 [Actibacterium atlanticum]
MFIRRTTYRLAPDFDTPDGQAQFEGEMRANIRPENIEGLISTSHVPNEDGSWTVVAVWETKVNAMAAVGRIREEWDRQASRLVEGPLIETAGIGIWEAG